MLYTIKYINYANNDMFYVFKHIIICMSYYETKEILSIFYYDIKLDVNKNMHKTSIFV